MPRHLLRQHNGAVGKVKSGDVDCVTPTQAPLEVGHYPQRILSYNIVLYNSERCVIRIDPNAETFVETTQRGCRKGQVRRCGLCNADPSSAGGGTLPAADIFIQYVVVVSHVLYNSERRVIRTDRNAETFVETTQRGCRKGQVRRCGLCNAGPSSAGGGTLPAADIIIQYVVVVSQFVILVLYNSERRVIRIDRNAETFVETTQRGCRKGQVRRCGLCNAGPSSAGGGTLPAADIVIQYVVVVSHVLYNSERCVIRIDRNAETFVETTQRGCRKGQVRRCGLCNAGPSSAGGGTLPAADIIIQYVVVVSQREFVILCQCIVQNVRRWDCNAGPSPRSVLYNSERCVIRIDRNAETFVETTQRGCRKGQVRRCGLCNADPSSAGGGTLPAADIFIQYVVVVSQFVILCHVLYNSERCVIRIDRNAETFVETTQRCRKGQVRDVDCVTPARARWRWDTTRSGYFIQYVVVVSHVLYNSERRVNRTDRNAETFVETTQRGCRKGQVRRCGLCNAGPSSAGGGTLPAADIVIQYVVVVSHVLYNSERCVIRIDRNAETFVETTQRGCRKGQVRRCGLCNAGPSSAGEQVNTCCQRIGAKGLGSSIEDVGRRRHNYCRGCLCHHSQSLYERSSRIMGETLTEGYRNRYSGSDVIFENDVLPLSGEVRREFQKISENDQK
ncbi:hypothetical protein J6590_052935 [Homalodisca vitripennis]|nr:hypothetical protein J6590_052935 [Homalodisca vitripennis]